MGQSIYLDYQATTPLAPEVLDAMLPWLRDQFANPHSAHRLGRMAAASVEVARGQVMELLGGRGTLIFTSGATEAINIALVGGAKLMRSEDPKRTKILTIDTEHAAVRDTILALETQGFEPVLLPVMADGLVDMETARTAIDERTALVAVMLVNNEIGVLQPLSALNELAKRAGALFFCDAVQGYGRVPLPPGADMISISGHKIYGPKGVGALWLREGLKLPPLLFGGGQEQGLRSGTLSPALCAGLGMAAKLMGERFEADDLHVRELWGEAMTLFHGWTLNGSPTNRYHGNLNIRREGLDSARLMSECRDIAFSLGSACASGSGRSSHVLRALGIGEKAARSSIRIGFGRYTTMNELRDAAAAINAAADKQWELQ
ncbi:cysteine desulfurase family protein [Rhizorhapis suberifaciens]|uniref:Cysteine desulfurase n=1 Tax=Rhizorhapis suberifaciens TaxID=13656 RepID=A0A840HX70_9SPHN|nr:cysteine desulfurase family protein [Rhizorhapis suberifaciens]MBB4642056.1 cysteine desulfurase [Rhizorhapis suberifaciens]